MRTVSARPAGLPAHDLKTTQSDLVASMLANALIVCGASVFWLASLWLLSPQSSPTPAFPLSVADVRNLDREPGLESSSSAIALPELEMDHRNFRDELNLALSHIPALAAQETLKRSDDPSGSADGTVGRRPGNATNAAGGQELAQRWELSFSAGSRQEFARQLDALRIELGCIGGGIPQVDYLSNLSGNPRLRSGASSRESRLYFMWRGKTPLERYTKTFFAEENIATDGRLLLMFLESELQQELLRRELDWAREHGIPSVSQIERTVFKTFADRNGIFDFRVSAQTYSATTPLPANQ